MITSVLLDYSPIYRDGFRIVRLGICIVILSSRDGVFPGLPVVLTSCVIIGTLVL